MRVILGILTLALLLGLPLAELDGWAAPRRAHVRRAGRQARSAVRHTPRRRIRRSTRARAQRRGRRKARRCRRLGDKRVPLKYLQGGAVWIPAEARCGGSFPVVVLLHGNNTSRERVKSIGGGRNLDRWARRYLNGKLIEPLILAEPIHFGACAPAARRHGLPYLFTGRFDFKEYRRRLEAVLRKNGIRARSWSFIGHSGAACCLQAGMFAVKQAWPEIKIWGSADGCYSGDLQAASILHQYGKSHTRVYNACRGRRAYSGYRRYERALLGPKMQDVKCDSTYYKRCRRHPTRPWFSYTTQFTGPEKHGKVLVELFKTIVFNQFPSKRRIAYRKRVAARRKRYAALRRKRARARRRAAQRRQLARRRRAMRQRRAARPRPATRRRPGAVATRDE